MSAGREIILCMLCTILLAAALSRPAAAHAPSLIWASALLGAPVQSRGGAQVGVVSDLLIDTARNRIGFIAVRSDSASTSVHGVPWSAIDWLPAGSHQYAVTLSAPIPVDSRYDVAASTPGDVDFSTGLLQRPVRAGNGVIVGAATDLLIDMPSGTPVDLLVATAGA